MYNIRKLAIVLIAILISGQAIAQDDADDLKIAALQALMAAPPEKLIHWQQKHFVVTTVTT